MNPNCDELEQLTALQALGALAGADAERLRELLAGNPQARESLRRFFDAAAALAASANPKSPRPAVRARVLESIRKVPQRPSPAPLPSASTSASADSPGFRFVRANAPWTEFSLPGTRFKMLSAGPDQSYVMLLVEIGPGVTYPEHDHLGPEEMYVLTGDLQSEGRSLGPGDFLHAEPGTHHRPLHSIHGCTALMVVPKAAFEAA